LSWLQLLWLLLWFFLGSTVLFLWFSFEVGLLKSLVAADPLPVFEQFVAFVKLSDIFLVLPVGRLAAPYRRI